MHDLNAWIIVGASGDLNWALGPYRIGDERRGLVLLVEMWLIACWIDPWLLKMVECLGLLLDDSNKVKHLLGCRDGCVFQLCWL